MTERDFERTLQDDLREFVDQGASPALRARVSSIPDLVPAAMPGRAWWPVQRFADLDTVAKLAIAAAAVALVAVVGINLLPANSRVGGSGQTLSPSPSPSSSPQPTPVSTARAVVDPFSADYSIGRASLTVDGVPLSFNVPASGWEPQGSLLISKSVTGPQGAEAVLYWAAFPDGEVADPCARVPIWPEPATAADLAALVSTVPGTELVSGPSDVIVGGRAAKHVVLIVREDVGCDPGFFYNWKAKNGGAMWEATELGDTIRVWIVDVDGTRLFIAGMTHEFTSGVGSPTVGPKVGQEIQQIVDSIRFE